MKKRVAGWISIVLAGVLFLDACATVTQSPTPQSPDAAYTQAAQTVMAQLTLSAGGTAVAQLTQIAARATETPLPATPTSTLAPTAQPSFTPLPVAATATSIPCDWAQFVGDVSVADNSTFTPGASFIKTWRIRNIGTCTWNAAYSLVFVGGDGMGAVYAQPLSGSVMPGDLVDISVGLTAPQNPGTYKGYWMLRNPGGGQFGINAGAADPFWVQIQVIPAEIHESAFDLAANYCLAVWRSGAGALGCPGFSGDTAGSVVLLTQPYLESRQENEPALWTRPNQSRDGWISGQFPAYRVAAGDHFLAEVGCLIDSQGCNVTFQLDYQFNNGPVMNLGSWQEIYDGRTTQVDVDLSGLAGKSVQFILSVVNNGSVANANAFWFVPHIDNLSPTTQLVLTWHETGGESAFCNELNVYLTGAQSGEARAVSCKGGRKDLGAVRLSSDEVIQFLKWVNRFKTFDAQVYRAGAGSGVLAYISFDGEGNADATDIDIQAMQNMAEKLFITINR